MCGIAGGMTKSGSPPDISILRKMQAALKHRGPDGEGDYTRHSVGLVHTRLAIVDVDGGAQPFVSENGVALVANGEIYNDIELRKSADRNVYRSASDNESVLHAYLRQGLEFTAHLRGMYAAALYDPRTQSLILTRDPFGIKPLFYLETATAFWFASELQVFAAAGLHQPNAHALARDQLFALQYTCGRESIVSGVKRVEPGETLVVQDGQIADRRLRRALPRGGRREPSSATDFARDFDRLWMDSVDVHRRSDVPYGVFLSGGTDSAAVLAAMAALEERPVVAYTAGFTGATVHDEREQASVVARAVGADHRCIEVTAGDFWASLPAIAQAMDDPVADYAIVPTYLLAQAAAQDVKVVLTGEGGDEVLAGYGRYRAGRRPWPFRKHPWSRHVLARAGVLRNQGVAWRAEISQTERLAKTQNWTRLQRVQAVDVAHWLPNDLLTKVDRCLMAHGVEGRVPFLDGPFAQFAFDLPDSEKVKGRLGKVSLRRWLARRLPESRPFDRKRGFSVPVGAWISQRGDALAPLVAAQPGVAASCTAESIARLFKGVTPENALAAWILLFYALWHQCHMLGVSSSGSVQDVLAQRP